MKSIILFICFLLLSVNVFSQCACCAGAGIGSSNGDYNNGILTLPKRVWVVETYADYRAIQKGNAPEEDERLLQNMFITSLGVRYGISNKITISALLPYVFLQTNGGNDRGVGDLIMMGTFNVFSKNKFNLALQAGIELPTGIRKNSNFDNTTVVVGSGSYDPMFGLVFSKTWNRVSLQGNGLFKWTTNGFDKNYYGNLSTQNVSISYQIKNGGNFCSGGEKSQLNQENFGLRVFGGYYGEWLDKLREDGEVDENSGYYLGFVNAGLSATYQKWAFPLTFSNPIITQMNGLQNAAGFRIRLGIIKSF